jgi:hypothetical protein
MNYKIKKTNLWQSEGNIIVETEACTRTLKIDHIWYNLNLPRMMFWISFSKLPNRLNQFVFVFNSNDHYASIHFIDNNDRLISCPFPNVLKLGSFKTKDGKICFGRESYKIFTKVEELIEFILCEFFSSEFLTLRYGDYNGENHAFFEEWASKKIMPNYKSHINRVIETLLESEDSPTTS